MGTGDTSARRPVTLMRVHDRIDALARLDRASPAIGGSGELWTSFPLTSRLRPRAGHSCAAHVLQLLPAAVLAVGQIRGEGLRQNASAGNSHTSLSAGKRPELAALLLAGDDDRNLTMA